MNQMSSFYLHQWYPVDFRRFVSHWQEHNLDLKYTRRWNRRAGNFDIVEVSAKQNQPEHKAVSGML